MNTTMFEAYDVIEVDRAQLKNADYNPRILSDTARSKLQRGIKKLGMLSPPTWNKRTGNIVGGHQRVAILDTLNKSKDYKLKVAAVDLDEVQEREANLLLNNGAAQGDFDLEKLNKLFVDTDHTLNLDGTGFDAADLYRLFGDSPFAQRNEELDALATKLRTYRAQYDSIVENSAKRDSPDFFIVVVFRDADDRSQFLQAMELDDNRFQDGRALRARLNIPETPKAE